MIVGGVSGIYRVQLRRGPNYPDAHPWAALDGRVFDFQMGPAICPCLSIRYAGEAVMRPDRENTDYPVPLDAPEWIAGGDLEFIEERRYPFPPPNWKPPGVTDEQPQAVQEPLL